MSRSRGRVWLRRLALLLGLAAALVCFRSPLLTGLAWPLVAAEERTPTGWVVTFDGHGHYDEVAQLCQERPDTQVLAIRLDTTRLEALGVHVPSEELTKRELQRRGIPGESVLVLRGSGRHDDDWAGIRCLRQWLTEHPHRRVTLICNRFRSRQKRLVLERLLSPAEAARVQIWAAAHPWYDETNWWRQKEGVLDLFNSYVGAAYTWACGDTGDRWQSWDADAFERNLEAAP